MPEFKIGDVVRLKCGGPAMVVDGLTETNIVMVDVVWIDANGPQESCYHPDVLVHSPLPVKN